MRLPIARENDAARDWTFATRKIFAGPYKSRIMIDLEKLAGLSVNV